MKYCANRMREGESTEAAIYASTNIVAQYESMIINSYKKKGMVLASFKDFMKQLFSTSI